MKLMPICAFILILAVAGAGGAGPARANDFLTQDEITKIQDAQEIDERVKIYLQAGALRLQTTVDRLSGTESKPGDPLELFSVEDMLDGYYRILHAVMLNLEDASRNPKTDQKRFQSAMKHLKTSTEAGSRQLEALKKIAESQRKEAVWNMVGRAMEINKGALDGATKALAKKTSDKSD